MENNKDMVNLRDLPPDVASALLQQVNQQQPQQEGPMAIPAMAILPE